MKRAILLFVVCGLLTGLLLSCSGDVPKEPAPRAKEAGTSSVFTRVLPAAPVNVCPNDGIQVDAGFDKNGNGKLDDSEVVSTQYVCHGSDGLVSLVTVTTEASGANCTYGGKKVSVGPDEDKNGALDSNEITSSNYLCNGANGAAGANGTNGLNSLVKVTSEPTGTTCSAGGIKVTSGIDANDNGVLDASEEGSSSYICSGSGGGGGGGGGGANVGISAPMGVMAAGADGKVVLTWNVNPADEYTSFNIYWSTNQSITKANSTKISGVAGTPINRGNFVFTGNYLQYTITGLTNGTTYYFFVTGVNASGESPASWPEDAVPGVPPLAPTGVTATAGNGFADISWTESANATQYHIYRSVASGVTATDDNGVAWSTDNSYRDNRYNMMLTNGTTYYYVVTAVNGYGESAPSAEVLATPQGPPATPTGFTATAGDQQVVLSWGTSTGATSYNVYDYTGWISSLLANTLSTSYTVTGLTNGNNYCYKVSAVSAAGESSKTDSRCATPNIAPAAPTGVSASAGDGQVVVIWQTVTGVDSYSDGYNIYWSTSSGVTTTSPDNHYVSYNDVYYSGAKYTVTGLTNGTTYYFFVTAENDYLEGPASSEVSVTPQAGNAAPTTLAAQSVTDTSATLKGSLSNPSGYTTETWFEYGTSTEYGNSTTHSSYAYSGNISISANLSGLTEKTTYHYRLVTQNFAGTFYGNDRTFKTLNTPQVVYSGVSYGMTYRLAVDGANIYWSGGMSGGLYYAPVSGDTATQLTSNVWNSSGIVVDATNVYAADSSTIKMISKTTGSVTTLASGLSYPKSLAVDDTYVYWAESSAIRKVNISGAALYTQYCTVCHGNLIQGSTVTAIQNAITSNRAGVMGQFSFLTTEQIQAIASALAIPDIATGLSSAQALAIDSSNVYWIDNEGIKKAAKTGGMITVLSPPSGYYSMEGTNMAVDSSHIYWRESGSIRKMALTGGSQTSLTSSSSSFAIDSTNIYFYTGESICKISSDGGDITTISYAPGGASYVAVDATNVYWSNSWGIYKAAK